MNTESQNKSILKHLQSGKSITPLEALAKFGSLRLGARIFELRQDGHVIAMERVLDEKTGKRFGEYTYISGRSS